MRIFLRLKIFANRETSYELSSLIFRGKASLSVFTLLHKKKIKILYLGKHMYDISYKTFFLV